MSIENHYQTQAYQTLVRNARKIEREGNDPVAWDRWLATVLFAKELHLISGEVYAACLRRYASRQP